MKIIIITEKGNSKAAEKTKERKIVCVRVCVYTHTYDKHMKKGDLRSCSLRHRTSRLWLNPWAVYEICRRQDGVREEFPSRAPISPTSHHSTSVPYSSTTRDQ